MTLNRVCLIGTIVATPRVAADDLGGGLVALLGVLDTRCDAIDRFRIRALDADLPAVGVELLVDGVLTYSAHRPVILVRGAVVLAEAEPAAPTLPDRSPPRTTHASPAPHDRAGYFRRLGAGSSRERLVWVRPTRVAPRTQ